ncbi:hypothetical protein MY11210_009286 [Beauveria gryllotalpidicola]
MATFASSGGAGALNPYGEAFKTPRDVPGPMADSSDTAEEIGAKDTGGDGIDGGKRRMQQKGKKVGGTGSGGGQASKGPDRDFTGYNSDFLNSVDCKDLLVTLIRAHLQPRTTFDEMFGGKNATDFLRKFDSWLDARGTPNSFRTEELLKVTEPYAMEEVKCLIFGCEWGEAKRKLVEYFFEYDTEERYNAQIRLARHNVTPPMYDYQAISKWLVKHKYLCSLVNEDLLITTEQSVYLWLAMPPRVRLGISDRYNISATKFIDLPYDEVHQRIFRFVRDRIRFQQDERHEKTIDREVQVMERGEAMEKVEDARLVSRQDAPQPADEGVLMEVIRRMERMVIHHTKTEKEKWKVNNRQYNELLQAVGKLPIKVNTITKDSD